MIQWFKVFGCAKNCGQNVYHVIAFFLLNFTLIYDFITLFMWNWGLRSKIYKINSRNVLNGLWFTLHIYHFIRYPHEKNLFSPKIIYGMQQQFWHFLDISLFSKESRPRSLRQIVFQSLLLIFNKRPHFYLMSRQINYNP